MSRQKRRKPPGTIVNEFVGASRADQDARPGGAGLGSRYGTVWIFVFLIFGTLGIVGGGIYMYDQELNVWLGENFDRELPWMSEEEEESETDATTDGEATTGDAPAATTDATTGEEPDTTTEAAPLATGGMTFGEIAVSGRLSEKSVVELIDKAKPELEKCYNETPSALALAGELPLKFSIRWNGRMSKLTAKSKEVYDKPLETCIRKVVNKVKFPKPRGSGTATVTIPLTFGPPI